MKATVAILPGLALALLVGALGGSAVAALPPEPPPPFHLQTRIVPKPTGRYEPTPVGMTITGRLGPIPSAVQPGTRELSIKIDATRLDLSEVPRCRGPFAAPAAPDCVEVAHGTVRLAYRFGFEDPELPIGAEKHVAIYFRSLETKAANLVARIPLPGRIPVVAVPVTATDEFLPKALRLTAELPRIPWAGATIESFRLTFPRLVPGRGGPAEPLTSFCPDRGYIQTNARAKTYSTAPRLEGEAFESCR